MNAEQSKRGTLERLAKEIFALVSDGATTEQWAEWLRVPLEHAAATGNLDLFNALIGAGADGSAGWRGCNGRTFFDAAAAGGSADVVSALLATGAQPDATVVSAASKTSALYLAARNGHEGAARRLVLAGANVHFRDPGENRDVLAKAVEGGHEHLVNDLISAGASPNTRDEDGRTPLHVGAAEGLDDVVCALMAKGADKDALDRGDDSPLVLAAECGHLSTVNILLAADADATSTGGGFTALARAARCGHVGVMEAILARGADVNATDEEGCTAMHMAAIYGQVETLDALVKTGGSLELRDTDGETPLGSAAYHSSTRSMLVLLRNGAKVEARANKGNTPLHLACSGQFQGLEEAVDLLLRWGADETATNADGRTPLEMLDSGEILSLDCCSLDEVDRVRLVFARAPVDRDWRRRAWLVMLRSRASRAKAAGRETGKGSKMDRNDAGSLRDGHGQVCKKARSQPPKRDGDAGAAGESEGLCGLVATLVELGMEGVFRAVVTFL